VHLLRTEQEPIFLHPARRSALELHSLAVGRPHRPPHEHVERAGDDPESVRLRDSTRRWIPELLARQLIVAGVVLYGGYGYTAAEELVKRVEFSRPEIVAEYGVARHAGAFVSLVRALAWLLASASPMLPIPGRRKRPLLVHLDL
jgi:hypothetical protein